MCAIVFNLGGILLRKMETRAYSPARTTSLSMASRKSSSEASAWPTYSVARLTEGSPLILGRRFTSPACNRLSGPLELVNRGWGSSSSFQCATKPATAKRVAVPYLTLTRGHPDDGTLLIWRSRYYFNFGDLLSYIVHIAASLVRLPPPLTIIVPPVSINGSLSSTMPEFYRHLLSAFASNVYLRGDEWGHRIYSDVYLCCLNNNVRRTNLLSERRDTT